MTKLHDDLQGLVDKEAAKSNARSVLLAVQSGDRRIDFRGSSGATTDDRFLIASVTKMFTATLVLQLKDTGRLSLDATVQSILREYDLSELHTLKGTAWGPKLTIRHLLHQTSGLADYYEGDLVEALKRGEDQAYGLDDVLRWTKALKPQARPDSGTSYYSDTNYQLLGAIIEAVTGKSFREALKAYICVPLGLRRTGVFDPIDLGAGAPLTIYNTSDALDVPLALSSMGPDGGIVSDLDDVLAFLRAYMSNALFSSETATQARQFNKLFFPIRYGFGLMRFKLPRWMNLFRETPELIGHSGSSGSFAFYAPNHDVYIVGTFNQIDAPHRPFGFMMRVLNVLKQHGQLEQRGGHINLSGLKLPCGF